MDDYLLYLRCPRSAHLHLTGEIPVEDSEYPVPSDREEVLRLAMDRSFPGTGGGNRELSAPPFVAFVDVWHPQRPEGAAAIIVRETVSLKHTYLVEQTFIRYCAEKAGLELTRQYVHHLDKGYVRRGEIDPEALFVAADVTRRVRLMLPEHRKRLEALEAELASDPLLELYRHRVCTRRHSCPVCGADGPRVDDDHVTTLYRGGELVGRLLSDGFTNITDVPEDRLVHPRQLIQKATLEARKQHIDHEALEGFLRRIVYPLHYLDFEAVNSAVPRYEGARPWEHVPYLFSIHTESSPGAELEHSSFLMRPSEDQRCELLAALLETLAGTGSVLVYGVEFESGVLNRLARMYPDRSQEVQGVIERLVDLLQPFREFSFYDSRQRGKTKLKTVLPVLTDQDYSGLVVRDGYTANLAYRYLDGALSAEAGPDAAEVQEICENLVRYCTMDTLAMVRIMSRLRALVLNEGASGRSGDQD